MKSIDITNKTATIFNFILKTNSSFTVMVSIKLTNSFHVTAVDQPFLYLYYGEGSTTQVIHARNGDKKNQYQRKIISFDIHIFITARTTLAFRIVSSFIHLRKKDTGGVEGYGRCRRIREV